MPREPKDLMVEVRLESNTDLYAFEHIILPNAEAKKLYEELAAKVKGHKPA